MSNDNQIDFTVRVKNEGLGELASDLDKVEEGAKGLGAAGTAAGAGVGKLGAAAGQAGSGLGTLAGGEGKAAAEAGALGASAKTAAQSVDTVGTSAGKAANELGAAAQKTDSFKGALTQVASAVAGAFTFKELVTAAAQMESMREGLRAVSGSAEAAGRDMEFVRTVANRVGADVVQVGQAYLGLAAATKGTAVEGEPTRQVFEAVATAMGKAGKSAAETQNALTALAQMASKGTVSMEELRGQLGEALPGALQAAANGLGITTQDLIKLVENGEIAASDLFPALSKGLKDLYGGAPQAQTLSQEITNIKNAFVEMAANLGEAGGLDALKKGAEVAQAAIVYLDDTLVTTGKTIGVVMAAIATLDFSGLKQSFTDIEAESRDKLLKAAQHNDVLRASIETGGTEAMKAALAQQQLGSATQQAGEAAAVTSPTWVKLASDYGKVLEVVREQIAAQEKSVIARDAEGKAAMAMAAAFGTETEQRQAQAKAAADNAAELEKLAQLKATELAVMNAELQALQALAKEQGKLDEQKQKQLQELEKLIALRQQDTDKAVAQAQASRMAATLAAAEAEALRDNSGRVKELRDAWEIARLTLEALNTEKRKGKASSEDVTQAEMAAGRAAILYRDALKDQLQAIQAKANAQQASISLEQAGVRLAIEQQRAIFEVARARGDESGAMRAQNEIRKLEIELLGLVAQAKRAEAQAALASIAAKREELQAAGLLTDIKRLELDAAQKAAQVKIKEAEIAETTAKKVRDLANAHQDLGAAAGSSVGGMNAATAAMGLQAEQLGKLQKLYDKHRLDKDKDPDRIGKSGDLREAAVMETDVNQEIARRYGEEFIDNDLAKKAFNLRLQLESYQRNYGNARSKQSWDQQRNIGAELERVEREIEKERQGKKAAPTAHTGMPAPPSSPAPSRPAPHRAEQSALPVRPQQPAGGGGSASITPAPGSSTGPTYISNITIPGIVASTQVRFADAQSQSAGERLLRELAQARTTAIR